jgi:methionyl-tRNA formyltransferase
MNVPPSHKVAIAVFAYSDTGHGCLKFLLDRGEDVALVVTHADDPKETPWFPSVAELARSRGIEPMIVDDPRDPAALASIEAAKPDLLLSFYYRGILPDSLLRLPRLGAFNVHGSLLPKYRGRAPVNWAILSDEKVTGATLHAMTAKPDAGDIVDQEPVPIGPDDTAIEVQRRVTAAAVKLLERRLEELKSGTAPRHPQDEAAATTFGRRGPQDGRIEWIRTSEQVHNLVRAVTHPYPGAFTEIFGGRTFLWKTRLPKLGAHDNFPGQIRTERGRLYVACGDDRYVEVLRLQREGEEEMDGSAFAPGKPR